MRTRSQSKRTEDEPPPPRGGARRSPEDAAAGRRRRAPSLQASGTKAKSSSLDETEEFPKEDGEERVNDDFSHCFTVKEYSGALAEGSTTFRGEGKEREVHFDANETDWEDGAISVSEFGGSHCESIRNGVTVEFTESPSSTQRKPSRRASAEEKELAELVHKVHLLCLLARGRLIDNACNDPLLQASLLSLLPSYLLKIAEVPKLTANLLGSIVNWFSNNFQIRSQNTDRGSFKSNLAFAIETRGGTAEEVAALSVVLFRALNLTARFVSILDVASLKPDLDPSANLNQDAPRLDTRIASPNPVHAGCHVHSMSDKIVINNDTAHGFSEKAKCLEKGSNSSCKKNLLKGFSVAGTSDDHISLASLSKACSDNMDSCARKIEGSKRKGDLEFELQMEMALSATAAGVHDRNLGSKLDEVRSPSITSVKKMRTCKTEESPVMNCCNTSAVWSRRTGPPLYWAEVYCSGEMLTGKWVHVDAANGIVDGEGKVESAAAACRRPLKYVVAFAGNGAKDVTRRYCTHWYKIASQRINSQWWDLVMEPLKELESGASGDMICLEASLENSSLDIGIKVSAKMDSVDPDETSTRQDYPVRENLAGGCGAVNPESPAPCPGIISRTLLEDMELETRALTEPLPTNQLAYKNHNLYVIERWLSKHQVLHPKGPVLGYCSGHPVYPRSCVQALRTKHKWLREGLQVKPNEVPAKVVKRSIKFGKAQKLEPSASEEDDEAILELYGKWQMEPLNLRPAVNGIVPKNERGQVDVWSEKCLPPGTVHLRLPRLVPVVKRLEIDYAPAMVGFEFRNGRSIPVFEGIVVCTEFKDAILEAYEEEEERREAEERKRTEAQSLSRWFQLLSSVITRQRLENSYVKSSTSIMRQNPLHDQKNDTFIPQSNSCDEDKQSRGSAQGSVCHISSAWPSAHDHEHMYPLENQTFDEENLVRTKRCPCGFSVQVEEL